METKLKPCPFCGKEAKLHQDSWPVNDKGGMAVAFWVKCAPCGSSSGEFKSKEKAIAAWNRRTAAALPCKVGDTVYQTDGVTIYPLTVKNLIFDAGHIAFDESVIGSSIFLTQEEAEAACGGDFQ